MCRNFLLFHGGKFKMYSLSHALVDRWGRKNMPVVQTSATVVSRTLHLAQLNSVPIQIVPARPPPCIQVPHVSGIRLYLSFCNWLILLSVSLQGSSMWQHLSEFYFLFKAVVCVCHILFTHLSFYGHLGDVYLLAITSTAAMNSTMYFYLPSTQVL